MAGTRTGTVDLVETEREAIPTDKTAADMARSGRLTPMLRQYMEVKQAHPSCVVFFRLGDFYECFFEDAVLVSEVVDLTLTARGKGPDRFAMAGMPHHAARGYIGRLVDAGHRVVIADQTEDAALAKGLVRREVVRVITPGMVVDDEVLEARRERLTAAVHLAPTGGALSLLDVSTGAFHAARFEDDGGLADELARTAPRELLLPDTPIEPDRLAALCERLPAVAVTREDPDLFNARAGRAYLLQHFGTSTLTGFGVEDGKAGSDLSAAAGAALRYATRTQRSAAAHVDRLGIYRPGDHLVLDDTSLANLEVLQTLQDGKRRGSLLGHVDRTVTAMGGRLVTRWLSRPLKDLPAIEARHDAVDTLRARASLRGGLRETLRRVADLERLVGRLALGAGNPRDLARLGQSLDAMPTLAGQLDDTGGLLADLAAGLEGLEDLADELRDALVDEPPTSPREGGIFRLGYHAGLDELVALSTEGKDFLIKLEAREKARTGIGSLKVRYNKVFGYYLEVTKANVDKVPEDYERRQTMKGAERYVTEELKRYEEQVLGAEDRRHALELEMFGELVDAVVARAPALRSLAEAVATIDVLASLAEVADTEGWCRPKLDDSVELSIEGGWHPVVAEALKKGGGEPFVPNDARLDGEHFLQIITGPNMAGKSTVMRQTALIALLAQSGSFVPAKRARVGLVDRIFTRVGASDNLARGQSTFMVEMTETANILNHATRRSLVILDEIGRGTSTYDGVSIAWAVAEHLHDTIRCRALFATHYHELTDLAKERPGVANTTVAVKEWNDKVVFLRKLVPGAANRSYGIQVARLAGLPGEVLDRASEVLANLEAAELDATGHPVLAHHKGGAREARPQLTLFGGASAKGSRGPSDVEVLLGEIDPDDLTPREAQALLYRLKGLLDDDAKSE